MPNQEKAGLVQPKNPDIFKYEQNLSSLQQKYLLEAAVVLLCGAVDLGEILALGSLVEWLPIVGELNKTQEWETNGAIILIASILVYVMYQQMEKTFHQQLRVQNNIRILKEKQRSSDPWQREYSRKKKKKHAPFKT